MPQVHAHALTFYAQVARFCGLDPYRMLRRVGLRADVLTHPWLLIPMEPAAWLLEISARESGQAGFALLMVQGRVLSDLGPMSLLLEHEGTARDVINSLIRYQALLGERLAVAIDEEADTIVIRTELAAPFAGPQSIELLTGMVYRTMSELATPAWQPDSVHFVHAAPTDLGVHRRLFPCPIVFESEFSGLICASASLAAPNPRAEAAMAGYAAAYLDLLATERSGTSLTQETRRALYLLLPAGKATLAQAAATLGLHPRRLQRALEQEGSSFAALLGEVRRELAQRYLATTPHSITTISQMMGYASPSSFTRWFTAELGTSPAAWRADATERPAVRTAAAVGA